MRKHNSTYRKGIRRRTEGETTLLYYFLTPDSRGWGSDWKSLVGGRTLKGSGVPTWATGRGSDEQSLYPRLRARRGKSTEDWMDRTCGSSQAYTGTLPSDLFRTPKENHYLLFLAKFRIHKKNVLFSGLTDPQ